MSSIKNVIELKKQSINLLEELEEIKRIEQFEYVIRKTHPDLYLLEKQGAVIRHDTKQRILSYLKIRNITNFTFTNL